MVDSSRRRRSDDDELNRSSSPVKAPQFFKIINSSAVPRQKLRIPRKFLHKYLKDLGNHVFLKVPRGAVWKVEVILCNEDVWLGNGWKEFADYYSIGHGHFLVFRYDGNSNFHVLIFDMTASEIEYPISATRGQQTDISHNVSLFMPETEDNEVYEISEDVPTYQRKRVTKIPETGEIGKDISSENSDGCPRCRKMRNAASFREDKERDDPPIPDSPFETTRTNKTCKTEDTSDMLAFSSHFQSSRIHSGGLRIPKLEREATRQEIGKECTGGPSIVQRPPKSPNPVGRLSSAIANGKSGALERARAFRSKNPYFMVNMRPTYVYTKHGVQVPKSFSNLNLSGNQNKVILRGSDGRLWPVKYHCCRRSGSQILRWVSFARGNNLKVGDVCVFELINSIEPCLNVVIFRAEEQHARKSSTEDRKEILLI